MKKLILTITIIMTLPQIQIAKAQSMEDFEYIFKMSLFYDGVIYNDSEPKLPYKEIFDYVCDNWSVTLHPVEKKGFDEEYHFFIVDPLDDIDFIGNMDIHMITSGSCLIIAINVKCGKYYRLKGFENNDFLDFMYDWMEQNKDFNHRRFFREHSVEGVDFKCLYKALRAKKKSAERPDCLKRVSDPIIIS